MTSPEPRALVLVGPMGAGKTSVGRRVARALGERFVDTDAVIAQQHGPIPEMFATRGELAFREIEREAVANSVAGGGVISLGGGAVLDASTRGILAAHRVAFLMVSPEVVASRLRGSRRPLLAGDEDPVAQWTRIFDERREFYDDVADETFDTSSGPLSGVVDRIVAWARSSSPNGDTDSERGTA